MHAITWTSTLATLLVAVALSGPATVEAKQHPKLSQDLSRLSEMARGAPGSVAKEIAKSFLLKKGPGGCIEALIEPAEGDVDCRRMDLAEIEATGAIVDAASRSYVRVFVKPKMLDRLADLSMVGRVRTPTTAKAALGMGSNVSESVALTGSADLQTGGITGAGVDVAVVDLGFYGLSAAIAAGELPATTVIVDLPGSHDDDIETATEHGVGVAEHLVDMAPGVNLHVIMVDDELDLENAADYIATNGIRIANHSVGWVNSSYYDGTGPINAVFNTSREVDGVLWTVASGNDAESHWRGRWTSSDTNEWLDFVPGDEGLDLVTASTSVVVFLNWDQYGSSVTDLDLYVYDRRGRIAGSSTNYQTGPEDPAEAVGFTYNPNSAPYEVSVNHWTGPTEGLDLTLFSFYNDLEYAWAASSLMDPANAPGVFTVGAIDQAVWNDADPAPQPYSSQGPTNDGRLKPELCAPDATTSLTYGVLGATGTSFTAPTVAGAAALLLEREPLLSADALEASLTHAADPTGELGADRTYGYGRLRLHVR